MNFHSYGMQNMNGVSNAGGPGPAAGPTDGQPRVDRMAQNNAQNRSRSMQFDQEKQKNMNKSHGRLPSSSDNQAALLNKPQMYGSGSSQPAAMNNPAAGPQNGMSEYN